MVLGIIISILTIILFIYYLQYVNANRYQNSYLLPSNALIDSYDVGRFWINYYMFKANIN